MVMDVRIRRFLQRLALLGILFAHLPAFAGAELINLEWRPASQTVVLGSTVNIGLYAVPDGAAAVPISVMDVVLAWDSGHLDFVGHVDDGPYAWLSSTFPPIGDSNLNDTFLDGNAFYTAQSQLGNPAMAPPEGLLVTTMQFVAVSETIETVLAIPETLSGADTIVIDGIPGLDVHGTLGSATVRIVKPVPCDYDQDGDVDLSDFAQFSLCFAGANVPPAASCPPGINADFDSDGDVDLGDFAVFSLKFTGPL